MMCCHVDDGSVGISANCSMCRADCGWCLLVWDGRWPPVVLLPSQRCKGLFSQRGGMAVPHSLPRRPCRHPRQTGAHHPVAGSLADTMISKRKRLSSSWCRGLPGRGRPGMQGCDAHSVGGGREPGPVDFAALDDRRWCSRLAFSLVRSAIRAPTPGGEPVLPGRPTVRDHRVPGCCPVAVALGALSKLDLVWAAADGDGSDGVGQPGGDRPARQGAFAALRDYQRQAGGGGSCSSRVGRRLPGALPGDVWQRQHDRV